MSTFQSQNPRRAAFCSSSKRPDLISVALISCFFFTSISAQPLESGQTFQINGAEIYFEETGKGSPLLLMHRFGGCGAVWKPFIPELSKHYRLNIPDLRGHGRSTGINDFTHGQAAFDIFALLDSLDIPRCKAIGQSSGGMTLIHMATQQPERIESMVLVGATIYFGEDARAVFRQSTPDQLSAEEYEDWGICSSRGDFQTREVLQRFSAFRDSYDDMNFTGPYLSTIQAKTLIVHGDRDEIFPVNIAMEMYASIPDAALWVVPHGGHIPIYGEMTESFLRVALKFLNRD